MNTPHRAATPTARIAPARVGDARDRHLFVVLLGLSILVAAIVLVLTNYKTFYNDEWTFVATRREWRPETLLLSHNGHWVTIPVLVWKVLFVVVGLHSHAPYEAALLAVHVAVVLLLFTLIRRRSGDLPAFAWAAILLVFGAGGENIVWAFQIAWMGSVAFGLLAMLLLEGDPPFPTRVIPASAMLLFSLMCSSVGLAFVAAVGIELALSSRRRRFLTALVVPVGAFIAWFFIYDTGNIAGAPGVSEQFLRGPTGFAFIVGLARFVVSGLVATAAGVVGAWEVVGVALLPLFVALIALRWYRRRTVEGWQLGMAGGILAFFTLAGLGRVQYGADYAAQSRYVYVAAVFLLPLIADAISDLPWRGLWRPTLSLAFALSLLSNTVLLRDLAVSQQDVMRVQVAELQTVELFRGAPNLSHTTEIDHNIMPELTAGHYLAAVDELGSPVSSSSLDELRKFPGPWVDRVMLDLFGPALTISADNSRSIQGLPCRTVDSTSGSTINLQVPDGEQVMLRSSSGGAASFFLGFVNPPTGDAVQHAQLLPGTAQWIHIPETGQSILWQLRITTARLGTIHICTKASLQVYEVAGDSYSAEAANGKLDAGWLSVLDPEARGGRAAAGLRGNAPSYTNDVFGEPLVPNSRRYDVWYRVRVSSVSGSKAEMTLGLWDDQGVEWVGSTTYSAKQIGTSYRWIKVASGVTPKEGHAVQFLASMLSGPSTDWYVDEAIRVPAGSSPPP